MLDSSRSVRVHRRKCHARMAWICARYTRSAASNTLPGANCSLRKCSDCAHNCGERSSIAAQQDLLELDQVLQDAPVPVPGDPAWIAAVTAIAFLESQRVLAPQRPPTAPPMNIRSLARASDRPSQSDQVQAAVIAHQQIAGMQVGVAQVQPHRDILQRGVQLRACACSAAMRMLLVPDGYEGAASLSLAAARLAGQPLPDRIKRRGFHPQARQRAAPVAGTPRAGAAAPRPIVATAWLNAASKPDWPSTYGNRVNCRPQRCTDAPPVRGWPGRDDFLDAQRAAQPMQGVPDGRGNLVTAALQPPLPAPCIDAIHTGVGIGANRAWHHGIGGDAIDC